jgi:hypothetical protein
MDIVDAFYMVAASTGSNQWGVSVVPHRTRRYDGKGQGYEGSVLSRQIPYTSGRCKSTPPTCKPLNCKKFVGSFWLGGAVTTHLEFNLYHLCLQRQIPRFWSLVGAGIRLTGKNLEL